MSRMQGIGTVAGAVSALLWMIVLLSPSSVAGQERSSPGDPPAANDVCPVTTGEQIDPEVFVDYEGKRVCFCCERCRRKFEREPDKYVVQPVGLRPADAQPAVQEDHGHSDDHTHDEQVEPTAAGSEEHAHEHGGDEHTPRWLSWLGNFHPPMVNFPIGVLVATAVAEALFILRRNPLLDHAARYGVWFAAITGVIAAFLGWSFGGFRLVDDDRLLLIHRWLGTGTAIWLLLLLWTSERARRPAQSPSPSQARARGWYLFLLFAGTALVLTTGFLGGSMVYGLDHYALP